MEHERYLDVIEEALVAFGSDHAALSALDVQVVLGWQQAGIPLAIALKGIRQGVHVFERVRKAEDPFPRRLAYFSTWVQKLFDRYRQRVFVPAASTHRPAPPDATAATEATAAPSSAPTVEPATFTALRAEFTHVSADASPYVAATLALLAADLEGRASELAADADLPVAWAVDANARLLESALDHLPPDTRASLQRTAEATVRARLPLATPEASSARARVELRRLLSEGHGVRFFDLRELSR